MIPLGSAIREGRHEPVQGRRRSVANVRLRLPAMAARDGNELIELQRQHRDCTRCVDAGLLDKAHPVFSGGRYRMLLVGQAPGPVEADVTRPFAGRAGRQLMRWMLRAGFADEQDFRTRVFMTSMTTCFPGRLASGAGDRRPSAAEVRLCSSWLDGYLRLLQPRLILPVGTLALQRFVPGARLDDVVGHAFDSGGRRVDEPAQGPVILPLPHPSGQSRWLNDPARLDRLETALTVLRRLVDWADG